jgi:septum formation protein
VISGLSSPAPRLILASLSPRRRELLARLPYPFEVRSMPVREFSDGELPAGELPLRNAEAKAQAVAENFPDAVVVGADTVIIFDGRIIGKPRDAADAFRTLSELSGRTHEVVTGVALLRRRDGLRRSWSVGTRVTFKNLSPDTIREYMKRVDVLDKAGSYALQEHGGMIVARVDGDADNVVGLPLERLAAELADLEM